ncbi:MAG: 30S ribosomal protein S17e [Candidatus Aenigmatarchaeota archaeon]|nr:MAG: 30S ribosomal protein S17e [Candidatus Aenigmarchaeota archaeon]
MGRIKTTAIKVLAREILEEHGDKFSSDFEKNKKIIDKVKKIESKKTRNVVAGYITKEVERSKKQGG